MFGKYPFADADAKSQVNTTDPAGADALAINDALKFIEDSLYNRLLCVGSVLLEQNVPQTFASNVTPSQMTNMVLSANTWDDLKIYLSDNTIVIPDGITHARFTLHLTWGNQTTGGAVQSIGRTFLFKNGANSTPHSMSATGPILPGNNNGSQHSLALAVVSPLMPVTVGDVYDMRASQITNANLANQGGAGANWMSCEFYRKCSSGQGATTITSVVSNNAGAGTSAIWTFSSPITAIGDYNDYTIDGLAPTGATIVGGTLVCTGYGGFSDPGGFATYIHVTATSTFANGLPLRRSWSTTT